jgi:MFS family permease
MVLSQSQLTALISSVGNFGIQYNFQVIAIALAFMDNSDDDDQAAFPRTAAQGSLLKSVVFAGAVVGQSVMGYAGDLLGRKKAMVLTNCFTAAGAVGCACFVGHDSNSIYTLMTACRFFLGVGVGGKYPLTASMRAEGSTANEHTSTEVAKGFFWQTPGSVAPYLMATIIFVAFGKKEGAEFREDVATQVRILFLLGAIPAVIVAILSMMVKESDEYTQRKSDLAAKNKSQNPISVACEHPEHLKKLIGTGVSWFLYDFVYYGTSLNQPEILNTVFGKGETLLDNCWQSIVLNLMGLPGVILAIIQLQRLGSKPLQVRK